MSFRGYLKEFADYKNFIKNTKEEIYYLEIKEKLNSINNFNDLLDQIKLLVETEAGNGNYSTYLDYNELLKKNGLDEKYLLNDNYRRTILFFAEKFADIIKNILGLDVSINRSFIFFNESVKICISWN